MKPPLLDQSDPLLLLPADLAIVAAHYTKQASARVKKIRCAVQLREPHLTAQLIQYNAIVDEQLMIEEAAAMMTCAGETSITHTLSYASGFSLTFVPYRNDGMHWRWSCDVINPGGEVIGHLDNYHYLETCEQDGEMAVKCANSSLYRDPAETTRGDW